MMHRVDMCWVALVAVGGAGCATPAAPPLESASPVAAPGAAAPGSASPLAPVATPTVTAPPAPEPDVPRLPNGDVIEGCEQAPPDMACIEGGAFLRGSDDGPENARPQGTVWLQTFYMDTYEVTNAAYKACRAAGDCPRSGPLYNDFSRDRQPITGVTWYAAVEFCRWSGKHLPTEAQWEKAARGSDGARTPYGDEPVTCEQAVIRDKRGRSCGVKKAKLHPEKGRVLVVGSRPPGRFGLYDMAGNAWEWVADWLSESWQACGDDCAGVDPRGPCGGDEPCPGHDERVVRGGSWYWTAPYAMSYYRRAHDPHNVWENFHHFGFRCAATVQEARALRATATQPSDAPAP